MISCKTFSLGDHVWLSNLQGLKKVVKCEQTDYAHWIQTLFLALSAIGENVDQDATIHWPFGGDSRKNPAARKEWCDKVNG